MAIQQRASGIIGYGQRAMDRIVPSDVRQRYYSATNKFATEQPLLAVSNQPTMLPIGNSL